MPERGASGSYDAGAVPDAVPESQGTQPAGNGAAPNTEQSEVPVNEPVEAPTGGDLDAIREELRRRQDSPQ